MLYRIVTVPEHCICPKYIDTNIILKSNYFSLSLALPYFTLPFAAVPSSSVFC